MFGKFVLENFEEFVEGRWSFEIGRILLNPGGGIFDGGRVFECNGPEIGYGAGAIGRCEKEVFE
jgi:hypothetical protein